MVLIVIPWQQCLVHFRCLVQISCFSFHLFYETSVSFGRMCISIMTTKEFGVLSLRLIYFFPPGLGFKHSTSHLQSKCSTPRVTPSVHFTLIILEMEPQELFALAGLEPCSS
jgi:hypothetical protein